MKLKLKCYNCGKKAGKVSLQAMGKFKVFHIERDQDHPCEPFKAFIDGIPPEIGIKVKNAKKVKGDKLTVDVLYE